MQRRDFLKVGCGVCLLGVAGVTIPGLLNRAQASTRMFYGTVTADQTILIPLTQLSGVDYLTVYVDAWSESIAVRQKTDGTYLSLLLVCTHQGAALDESGDEFTCEAHGSRFDENGNVLQGPATDPLTSLPTSVINGQLVMDVRSQMSND
jgi:cytochrome b6-f complex iron-sulfur subunit